MIHSKIKGFLFIFFVFSLFFQGAIAASAQRDGAGAGYELDATSDGLSVFVDYRAPDGADTSQDFIRIYEEGQEGDDFIYSVSVEDGQTSGTATFPPLERGRYTVNYFQGTGGIGGGTNLDSVSFAIQSNADVEYLLDAASEGSDVTVSYDLPEDADTSRDYIRVAELSGSGDTYQEVKSIDGKVGTLTFTADNPGTHLVSYFQGADGDEDDTLLKSLSVRVEEPEEEAGGNAGEDEDGNNGNGGGVGNGDDGDEEESNDGSGGTPVDVPGDDGDNGGGDDEGNNEPEFNDSGALVQCESNCGFAEFIALLKRVVNFLLISIAAPFAAIFFVYAGFLYMTSAGNTGRMEQAKSIFVWIVIGFAIALSAWLLVSALLGGLGVQDAYNFLD